jgi:YfiR/HmsC-like
MGASREKTRRGLWPPEGRRLARLALAVCLALAFPCVEFGQARSEEYRIKAAYLGKIPSFVEWPPSAGITPKSAFQLCTVGYFPFGTRLASEVDGVTVAGRKIELRLLRRGQELHDCDMVFFDQSEEKYYQKMLESLQGKSVLTVGETKGFLEAGGIMEFRFENDRLQIEVNLVEARKAKLKLDARLLALAKRVVTEQGAPGG